MASPLLIRPATLHETWLDESAPTTNRSAGTTREVGYDASLEKRIVIRFDISDATNAELAGQTISVATFAWKNDTNGFADGDSLALRCALILPPSDFVANQATWNIYKTANNWPNSAGNPDTSHKVDFTLAHADSSDISIDVVALAAYARANNAGLLDMVLLTTETIAAGTGFASFFPATNGTAGNRPSLTLTYAPTPVGQGVLLSSAFDGGFSDLTGNL